MSGPAMQSIPDDRARGFATREDHGLDPPHPLAPAQLRRQRVEVSVEVGSGENARALEIHLRLAELGPACARVAWALMRCASSKNGYVRFRWKDYGAGSKSKVMLDAHEFIRRLFHVLPKSFRRIRHFSSWQTPAAPTNSLERCPCGKICASWADPFSGSTSNVGWLVGDILFYLFDRRDRASTADKIRLLPLHGRLRIERSAPLRRSPAGNTYLAIERDDAGIRPKGRVRHRGAIRRSETRDDRKGYLRICDGLFETVREPGIGDVELLLVR